MNWVQFMAASGRVDCRSAPPATPTEPLAVDFGTLLDLSTVKNTPNVMTLVSAMQALGGTVTAVNTEVYRVTVDIPCGNIMLAMAANIQSPDPIALGTQTPLL